MATPGFETPVRVAVGGHSIAYRIEGEGPPLVLLHGFLCDSRCWRAQFSGLKDAFTLVAWDAPGAGLSSDPNGPFTIADWSMVLAGLLDSLAIEKAHFLGLSWGGLLAQDYCREFPGRVDRLVLSDTYAGWKGSFPPEVVERRRERCYRDAMRPPNEVVDEWVPVEFFSNASEALAAEMRTVVSGFHPTGFRLMAASLADTDTTPYLSRIEAPTLLLWVDGDLRSPLSVAEQFHEAIPGSRLSVISGAGHVSNMEKPDEFNAQVRHFLSSA